MSIPYRGCEERRWALPLLGRSVTACLFSPLGGLSGRRWVTSYGRRGGAKRSMLMRDMSTVKVLLGAGGWEFFR